MNLQQIFDTGVRGIVAQDKLSKTSHGTCKYRSRNGTKCALGHSIPDDQYGPRFENQSPTFEATGNSKPNRDLARILGAETERDCDKLRKFQSAHDGATDVRDFLARAESFAERYELNKDVLRG